MLQHIMLQYIMLQYIMLQYIMLQKKAIALFIEFCAFYATRLVYEPPEGTTLKKEEIITLLEECLAMAYSLGQIRVHINIAWKLASIYHKGQQISKAIPYYDYAITAIGAFEQISPIRKEIKMEFYNQASIAHKCMGHTNKLIEYTEEMLKIAKELGNIEYQEQAFFHLGEAYFRSNELQLAKSYFEKSLDIAVKNGDKLKEGIIYGNLATILKVQRNFQRAKELHNKGIECLLNSLETGDITSKLETLLHLGYNFQNQCQYSAAIKYFQRGLELAKQNGDMHREQWFYFCLGNLYKYLGDDENIKEHFEKSLNIAELMGNKEKKGQSHISLGMVLRSLGEYKDATNHLEKGLNIAREIDDKVLEITAYGAYGDLYKDQNKYHKAIECYETAIRIDHDSGGTVVAKMFSYELGDAYRCVMKFDEALTYHRKALELTQQTGFTHAEAKANYGVGNDYLLIFMMTTDFQDLEKSKEHLHKSLECFKVILDDITEKDETKISMADTFIMVYKALTAAYIQTKEIETALLTCDEGKARALSDLLGIKHNITNTLTTPSKKNINMKDIRGILYSSVIFYNLYFHKVLAHIWAITSLPKNILFYDEKFQLQKVMKQLDEFGISGSDGYIKYIVQNTYDDLGVRNSTECEDRSTGMVELEDKETSLSESTKEAFRELSRNVFLNDNEDMTNLEMLFDRFVSPVMENLTQEEIIIIPDGALFMVPFAALRDPKTGKYLSDTKRIRIAPSLRTLYILQQSSDDHFQKTGALIIGNPATGNVMYRGKEKTMTPLPGAETEAKEISKLLGVEPLIGKQATKQVVLSKLKQGVSVIHFAAHGSEKNGQIFLAPTRQAPTGPIPEEEDYILSMREAQECDIKAQLVVLSCCHSGRGQIKSEGVVGMARAFLAAGARAVVASLWAIADEPTRVFMVKFYSHLKKRESASRSLQQAMKEMRETENYKEPKYWAAFFLIGDDVTIQTKYNTY